MDTPAYPDYATLRAKAEDAARADGWFVDPRKLRQLEQIRRGLDWTISVLGHSSSTSLIEMHMLLIADRDNLTPPLASERMWSISSASGSRVPPKRCRSRCDWPTTTPARTTTSSTNRGLSTSSSAKTFGSVASCGRAGT